MKAFKLNFQFEIMLMNFIQKVKWRGVKNTFWKALPPALLLLIFYLAMKIRLIPLKSIQYLQALDPYQISRMSYSIVKYGAVPVVDFLRSFPYSAPTSFGFFAGESAIPAYLFKFFNWLTNIDFLSWTQIYPALMGALMVVVMYFIGKEVSNKWVGLSSSFFLATSAAVLHRSSAGWFEKEAIAGVLMLLSIYFIVRAWKRKSWGAGILSGIFLAISMTSWGGTQHLFLLYPLTAFIVLLFNEDTEALVCAFTPTLLIGNFLAFALSSGSFRIPSSLFLASMGILGLIWIRYLAGKYNWVSKKKLPYLIPVLCVIGLFILLLMPLFSQNMSKYTTGLISLASQSRSTSGVVGNTVAENNPASAMQTVSQLGAFGAKAHLSSFLSKFSEYFSPWTFALVGLTVMGTLILLMFYRKFKKKDEVSARTVYGINFAFMFALILMLFMLMKNITVQNFSLIFTPYLIIMITSIILLSLFNSEKITRKIEFKWYYILLLLWLLSALYGSAQKARIIFLTAQPIAFFAGYGFVMLITEIKNSLLITQIGEFISKQIKSIKANYAKIGIFLIILTLILIPTIRINLVNADSMARGIGGSPNTAWMQDLDFIRQNTSDTSVILSWWDYGYWFETLGARAAIVDGGNAAHYVMPGEEMLNFYIADFFTDSNYTNWLPRFKARGINYLVLDYTMIGKYSAVTQIHNRNNSKYTVLQNFQFEKQAQSEGKTYLTYCVKSGANCVTNSPKIFIPVLISNTSLTVTAAPIFRDYAGNTAHFSTFCSKNGIKKFAVPEDSPTIPGCPHFDPYYGMSGLVYVPKESVNANLVKLYLRDGNEMPEFEKVFDNGFVKMWKINYSSEG